MLKVIKQKGISSSEVLFNFKQKLNCKRNEVSATEPLGNLTTIRLLKSDLRTELQEGMIVTTSFTDFGRFSYKLYNIF